MFPESRVAWGQRPPPPPRDCTKAGSEVFLDVRSCTRKIRKRADGSRRRGCREGVTLKACSSSGMGVIISSAVAMPTWNSNLKRSDISEVVIGR
jgi:hypothetical protein